MAPYIIGCIHMIRTQIYLPEPLYAQIKLQARAKGQPAAQLIREQLEQSFPDSKLQPKKDKNLAELAEELNIRGSSDLSRRIDDYLYSDK